MSRDRGGASDDKSASFPPPASALQSLAGAAGDASALAQSLRALAAGAAPPLNALTACDALALSLRALAAQEGGCSKPGTTAVRPQLSGWQREDDGAHEGSTAISPLSAATPPRHGAFGRHAASRRATAEEEGQDAASTVITAVSTPGGLQAASPSELRRVDELRAPRSLSTPPWVDLASLDDPSPLAAAGPPRARRSRVPRLEADAAHPHYRLHRRRRFDARGGSRSSSRSGRSSVDDGEVLWGTGRVPSTGGGGRVVSITLHQLRRPCAAVARATARGSVVRARLTLPPCLQQLARGAGGDDAAGRASLAPLLVLESQPLHVVASSHAAAPTTATITTTVDTTTTTTTTPAEGKERCIESRVAWRLSHAQWAVLAAALQRGAEPEGADVAVRLVAVRGAAGDADAELAVGGADAELAVGGADAELAAEEGELARGVLSLRDVADEMDGRLVRFELPLVGCDGQPAGDLLLSAVLEQC